MIVCSDVDGVLIDFRDRPRFEVVDLLFSLKRFGCKIYVWSGAGMPHARNIVYLLGLEDEFEVIEKGSIVPDLAIDDMDENLGKANLMVNLPIFGYLPKFSCAKSSGV